MKLFDPISAWSHEIAAIRRDLHTYPELAFEETRTADQVASWLEKWGIPVHRGLGVTLEQRLDVAVRTIEPVLALRARFGATGPLGLFGGSAGAGSSAGGASPGRSTYTSAVQFHTVPPMSKSPYPLAGNALTGLVPA